MISIMNIIRKWKNFKLIEGVVVKDGEVEDLESTDMNDWILKLRPIRKKKKQKQVIIEVVSNIYLRKLITNSDHELYEEHIHFFSVFPNRTSGSTLQGCRSNQMV